MCCRTKILNSLGSNTSATGVWVFVAGLIFIYFFCRFQKVLVRSVRYGSRLLCTHLSSPPFAVQRMVPHNPDGASQVYRSARIISRPGVIDSVWLIACMSYIHQTSPATRHLLQHHRQSRFIFIIISTK